MKQLWLLPAVIAGVAGVLIRGNIAMREQKELKDSLAACNASAAAPPAPPPLPPPVPYVNPHPLKSVRIVEGTAPDSMGVLHDDLRHVTCWFETTCPGETTHGCSSAMACLGD